MEEWEQQTQCFLLLEDLQDLQIIRLLARCAVKCILVLLLSNSVFFLPELEGLLQFSA